MSIRAALDSTPDDWRQAERNERKHQEPSLRSAVPLVLLASVDASLLIVGVGIRRRDLPGLGYLMRPK